MGDQTEELLREIAAKHGIAVSRDDPILILQTINSRLLQDSAKAQQVQLDQFKQEMDELSRRWSTDTREKAERIVNAALAAARESMAAAMQEGGQQAARAARQEIAEALQQLASPVHAARVMAMLNVIASMFTMLAAALVLWIVLR
ncbi:conjugal transfer protein TraM [Janthinobacterium sp. HLX7-2]|uniref:conjugal transfer protein TraM n=1 Tax=Janthinobacterium sp. HLX7-2 TaxID=1259331 RepID=UPI003F273EFA